jgi:hypothetical protein
VGFLGSNAASIILGIAGIVASVVCAWLFYWLGGRIARRENGALLKEINELRKLLADYVQSMSERLGSMQREDGRVVASDEGSCATVAVARAEPNAAIEGLVRASLGALVNERGEVDMSRLVREVSLATGPTGLSAAFEVLRQLRSRGVVEWDGSDDVLPQVHSIRLQPLRSGRNARRSVSDAEKPGVDWVSGL